MQETIEIEDGKRDKETLQKIKKLLNNEKFGRGLVRSIARIKNTNSNIHFIKIGENVYKIKELGSTSEKLD